MLAALLLTQGFLHVWQLPARLDYDGGVWLETLRVYITAMPQGAGPVIEVAALLATAALAVMLRHQPRPFLLTLVAAVSLVFATAAWWIFIEPVNRELLLWTADTLPRNWSDFRDQWETAHNARAGLMLVALGALVGAAFLRGADRRPPGATGREP